MSQEGKRRRRRRRRLRRLVADLRAEAQRAREWQGPPWRTREMAERVAEGLLATAESLERGLP